MNGDENRTEVEPYNGAAETEQLQELIDRYQLQQALLRHFDESELSSLVFHLGIDYDDLPGQTRKDKAKGLIQSVELQNRIPELIEIIQVERPNAFNPQPSLSPRERRRLLAMINEAFDEEELRTLAFDLLVDYEDLRGSKRGDKARELILYLERRDQLPMLIESAQTIRPHMNWGALGVEIAVSDAQKHQEDSTQLLQIGDKRSEGDVINGVQERSKNEDKFIDSDDGGSPEDFAQLLQTINHDFEVIKDQLSPEEASLVTRELQSTQELVGKAEPDAQLISDKLNSVLTILLAAGMLTATNDQLQRSIHNAISAAGKLIQRKGDQDGSGSLPDTDGSTVTEEEEEDDKELPQPLLQLRVWLYMVDGQDEAQINILKSLDPEDKVGWGANGHTKADDIVLMYRTSPYSDIAYLFRAAEPAVSVPKTPDWPWPYRAQLVDKKLLQRPVKLVEMREHPRLAEWGATHSPRGALRWKEDIRQQGYWENGLRGLLVAWNPLLAETLAQWENSPEANLLTEALEVADEILEARDRSSALCQIIGFVGKLDEVEQETLLVPFRADRDVAVRQAVGNVLGPVPVESVDSILSETEEQFNEGSYEKVIQRLRETQQYWEEHALPEQRNRADDLLARSLIAIDRPEEAQPYLHRLIRTTPKLPILSSQEPPDKEKQPDITTEPSNTTIETLTDLVEQHSRINPAATERLANQILESDPTNTTALEGKARVLAQDKQRQLEAARYYGILAERPVEPIARAYYQAYAKRLRQNLPPRSLAIEDVFQQADIAQIGSGNVAANTLNLTLDQLQIQTNLPPDVLRQALKNLVQQVGKLPTISATQKANFQFRADQVMQRATQNEDPVETMTQLQALRNLPFVNYLFIDQPALRRALIRAVCTYRERPYRRTVLYLRSLARRRIWEEILTQSVVEANLNGQIANSMQAFDNLFSAVWQQGMVKYGERAERSVSDIVAGGEADLQPRDWRQNRYEMLANESVVASINLNGNFYFDAERPELPTDLLWQELYDLLFNQSDFFKGQDSWYRLDHTGLGGLAPLLTSGLLHIFHPETHLPYDEIKMGLALQRLGVAEERLQMLSYRGFIELVNSLLLDEDLGFESLADVGLFLQLVAEDEKLTGYMDRYTDKAMPLHQPLINSLNIEAAAIDSELMLPDSIFEQIVSSLSAGNHIILIGPPGTGKTTLAHDICRHAQDRGHCRGFISVTATADWTTFDTVGGYMPTAEGQLKFNEGIVLRAVREKKWLVIDEINRADIDKAFGELFTVLSGQEVTLPYRHGYDPVRILPPGKTGQTDNDYPIPPSWRIVGTMNVYDKASLFAMSYAFMRRFAFIDVGIPRNFGAIINQFLLAKGLAINNDIASLLRDGIFKPDGEIMRQRQLGPAIVKDVVSYVYHRAGSGQVSLDNLCEALLLYAIPQFDGLERDKIEVIYRNLCAIFKDTRTFVAIQVRLAELFPQYADLFTIMPE
ncbi:MAG: AAA family ATPase [Chloroflexi bacterium]|nr:AAA family ATPase [Chloroflexota bacterium]MCI0729793.1 AAA family ATPase [Chloroflexota bacterium]